jgi:ABC-type transport system substrate-binding protein
VESSRSSKLPDGEGAQTVAGYLSALCRGRGFAPLWQILEAIGTDTMNRRKFLHSASAATVMGGLASLTPISLALAQSKQETLLVISESGPNSLDVQGVGTNRPGYEVAWNCYDRLVTYALKTLPDGSRSYDQRTIAPELAERWDIDAKGVTFHLRKEATFHDGTPVTAADVKWSFDRGLGRWLSSQPDGSRKSAQAGAIYGSR